MTRGATGTPEARVRTVAGMVVAAFLDRCTAAMAVERGVELAVGSDELNESGVLI